MDLATQEDGYAVILCVLEKPVVGTDKVSSILGSYLKPGAVLFLAGVSV